MRVGANARQYAQIKKLHAQGMPASHIAKTFQMTAQSLERILAHIDDRKMQVVSEAQDSGKVSELQSENAELRARLEQYESGSGGQPGTPRTEGEEDEEDEEDENEED